MVTRMIPGLFKFTTGVESISIAVDDIVTPLALTSNSFLVKVDASSGNVTIDLLAASSQNGVVYIFKKIDSSGNSVTIDANGSETIDGEGTIVLNLQYAYVTIACDGDEWFIIGGEYVKMDELLQEQKDLQKLQLILLRILAFHLGIITGEVIKEDDLNA